MSKVSQKVNLSSMQVLKTLLALLQGDYTMNELIKILNKNEKEEVFNNSVISKYINTCRHIGIKIPKIQNKYLVSSIPFGLELTEDDLDALKILQVMVNKTMSSIQANIFDKFYTKLNRFISRKVELVRKDEYLLSIELFERAVLKRRKVNLLFKNKVVLECIPLNVSEINGKLFFNVYNKRVRMIDSSRLSGIEILSDKFAEPFNGDQVTIFKLKGNLARRYEIRDNESREEGPDGTVIITNKNENKDLLFSRLMRYQDQCEILKPKAYRDDFEQFIIKTLENYGIIEC